MTIADAKPMKALQCLEVWGGNRQIDSGVIMPGLDAWVFSQPADADSGGGDVHYVSSCASGEIVRILVADVSGHGSRVSETAARLRMLMRRHVGNHSQLGLVNAINRQFGSEASDGRFATAVVMTFQATSNRLLVASCGHPAPLIYRARSQRWSLLDAACDGDGRPKPGLPLGIEDQVEFEQARQTLDVGDVVVCYTDSLPEARVEDGKFLGSKGLLELLDRIGATDPGDLPRAILAAIHERGGPQAITDDLTILAFRPNGLRGKGVVRDRMLAAGRLLGNLLGLYHPGELE